MLPRSATLTAAVGDVALFEVAATYQGDTPETQRRVAGGIRRGTAALAGSGRHWAGNGDPVGVFDAKADALAVLEACGAPVANLQIEPAAPGWYHPGRSGVIKLGPKVVLGHFGEFHPKAPETLDVSGVPVRLRGFRRRHSRAEAQGHPHQAGAGGLALSDGTARFRLRCRTRRCRPLRCCAPLVVPTRS